MGYIKLFSNTVDYQDYINGDPLLPNVSLVDEEEKKSVFYNPFVDYSKEYMYVEALEDGMSVSFTKKAKSGSLYYSLDKQEWNELTEGTPAVNSGEKVYFKGNLVPAQYNGIGKFTINKQCNVAGNVMSLLFVDDFAGKTDLTGYDYAFYNLFNNCITIQSAKNLILPATKLVIRCYYSMFYGCTSLTTAPELPATTLAKQCYESMFYGCTSLTTAPELPATTLSNFCYQNMFNRCSSLTTAPELPATTLADQCYSGMFSGTNVLPDCSNIDFSSSTVVASGGLQGLFKGTKITDEDLFNILPVNENGKYYLPVTTLANSCYAGMFGACKNLTTAPELPATTLANNCYSGMFSDCFNLTTAPELPATTLAKQCYSSMFQNCALITAPTLPATTLTEQCYSSMFYGCTSLTTAPELPATTLAYSCYYFMFNNCKKLTTAPTLPATTLANYCYSNMFNGCTRLNYIKILATDVSAPYCLDYWVNGVSPTGTFVKAEGVEIPSGTSGIPNGWTVQTA